MNLLNHSIASPISRPIKVLQFGEGNFLRGFVDYMIDTANEKGFFNGNIAIVKPIKAGSLEEFRRQDCQYTVSLRGIDNGQAKILNRQISSVDSAFDAYEDYDKYMALAALDSLRYIISNTTEAGIVFDATDRFEMTPPKTFPGKLTKFLYNRYKTFNRALDKGLVMLPVELIDDNGIQLRSCVLQFCQLWSLEKDFLEWIEKTCVFCSTLVDRIITGYPKDTEVSLWKELGYEDKLIVTGEPFALWVIECPSCIAKDFSLDKAGLPVVFTDNLKPYKERKVRILNGAHTSFTPVSFLSGNDFVLDSIQNETIYSFISHTIFDEIIPTLSLPASELTSFAESVITRFNNPHIKHSLLSISLNSISKWQTRCLPSLLSFVKSTGTLPKHLVFSLAALMAFYTGDEIRNNGLIGHRNGREYVIIDDMSILEFFLENSPKNPSVYVKAVLSNINFWKMDLTSIPELCQLATCYLEDIASLGIKNALTKHFSYEKEYC